MEYMSKIIVTGSCGYIGSHTVVDLIEQGYEVISLDCHINSSPDALIGVEKITNIKPKHYPINLCDLDSLEKVFSENPDVKGVIHFAALKSVNESVEKPQLYYYNNLIGMLNLLEMVAKYKVNHFIFSSSCSVYGQSTELPVNENTPLQEAECPYAYTKQVGERILIDICLSNKNFQCIILRYFNPAGAHSSYLIGESTINIANNLVPVITETAIGKRESLTVFGSDYNTVDGSCIRDYIHVMDVAKAHTKAIQYLESKKNISNCEVFNLGAGLGLSVLQVIQTFEKVTGQKLNYKIGPRREGDVEAVYSNISLAFSKLNWKPESDIREILNSAWEWEKKRSAK